MSHHKDFLGYTLNLQALLGAKNIKKYLSIQRRISIIIVNIIDFIYSKFP